LERNHLEDQDRNGRMKWIYTWEIVYRILWYSVFESSYNPYIYTTQCRCSKQSIDHKDEITASKLGLLLFQHNTTFEE
jgi:hypothetical protein